jgi:VanZ family protein
MDDKTTPGASACRTALSGWLPPAAWAVLIFALSAQPNLRFVPDQELDFVVRKVGHMGVFGIFVLLVWSALSNTSSPLRRPWAWAFALVLLYAATDELHQGFVAGRHPSVVDVAIDGSGAFIALAVVGALRSRR